VLPIESSGGLKEAFNVRIEELRHIDFTFLHGYPRPTLCLLYEDPRGSRHIVTHSVDLRERELVEGPWIQTNVEFGARILVAVPMRYGGGVILIGQSTITFLSHPVTRNDSAMHSRGPTINSHSGSVFQTSVGISRTHITSYCLIESQDGGLCRYLLGDQFGNLSVLILHSSGESSPALHVEPLGVTSISETISHLGNGIIFIGSCFGDSQLLKLHRDPPSPDSESLIEELDRFPNIGPILDLCFLRNGNVGQVGLIL
jgi:DNA damage-binding protein 1